MGRLAGQKSEESPTCLRGAEIFQHIQEKLAETWVSLETMKAFPRAAEADAELDEWGVMRPAWNPLDAARSAIRSEWPEPS